VTAQLATSGGSCANNEAPRWKRWFEAKK